MRRTRLHRLLGLLVALALIAPAVNAIDLNDRSAVLTPELTSALAEGKDLRVIARFDDAVTDADVATMRVAGFSGPIARFTVLPALSAVGSPDAVRRLANAEGIVRIDANETLSYQLDRSRGVTRSEPLWDAEYTLNGQAATGGFTGEGIGVAVIDSGVDATHPDLIHEDLAAEQGLEPVTVENLKFAHTGPLNASATGLYDASETYLPAENSDTTSGHGTHVAGIVAGSGHDSDGRYAGIAPGADLIGLGAGDGAHIFAALAALQWVHDHHAEHGIRVINNSWGGAGEYNPGGPISLAVKTLVEQDGIVVVFAAGNDGGDGSTVNTNTYANDPRVINVANIDDYTGWAYSGSSRGKKDRPETWPTLGAAGYQIVSTATATGAFVHGVGASYSASTPLDKRGDEATVFTPVPGSQEHNIAGQRVVSGRYAVVGGTSMAAPAVAGIVALMLEANPALTPAQVKNILIKTATMPAGLRHDSAGYAIGHGMADAAEAVAVALKVREGLSVDSALGAASLDTTNSPWKINTGAGPVTDQSIPGIPVTFPAASTPAIYQSVNTPAASTGANPFLAAVDIQVLQGSNVGLAARSMLSRNEADYPLTLGAISAEHRIVDANGNTVVVLPAVVKADTAPALRADAPWAVPSDFSAGQYFLQTWVTYPSSAVRQITSLRFTVVDAP